VVLTIIDQPIDQFCMADLFHYGYSTFLPDLRSNW